MPRRRRCRRRRRRSAAPPRRSAALIWPAVSGPRRSAAPPPGSAMDPNREIPLGKHSIGKTTCIAGCTTTWRCSSRRTELAAGFPVRIRIVWTLFAGRAGSITSCRVGTSRHSAIQNRKLWCELARWACPTIAATRRKVIQFAGNAIAGARAARLISGRRPCSAATHPAPWTA